MHSTKVVSFDLYLSSETRYLNRAIPPVDKEQTTFFRSFRYNRGWSIATTLLKICSFKNLLASTIFIMDIYYGTVILKDSSVGLTSINIEIFIKTIIYRNLYTYLRLSDIVSRTGEDFCRSGDRNDQRLEL